jgi:thioredoxin reductase (NADPH)
MKATSGQIALDTVHKLKARNQHIALFLTDHRMPEMNGVKFLSEAMKIYPNTKKVLLTAYADTKAAIAAINEIGLDHYLMKPWDPPELHLYPVLEDLLEDWLANEPMPYAGIRVAGTLWSASSHKIKDYLSRSQMPYKWLDIEKNAEALNLVEGVSDGKYKLPVVFFPDGTTLMNPDLTDLAEKLGLQTEATMPFYDLIIIGAGPSGLSCAVYGASEGLNTLLIDKETTGGQAGTSSRIENYMGFPKGISGIDLARRATAQADRLGAEILTTQEVVEVGVEDLYRYVKLSNGEKLNCKALVIATGVTLRELDVPGVKDLTGAGVYYGAAVTEAAHYAGKEVVVLGGANSAAQGAMFFSRYAKHVTMVVRKDTLRMSQYLVDQIEETPNIDILRSSTIEKVKGKNKLDSVEINNESGKSETIDADALFIFIGGQAHTEFLEGIITRNNAGFILTGDDLQVNGKRPKNWRHERDPYLFETSVPGIFAVGDVRHGAIRRVASAVGQGSTAVSMIHQYLSQV